MSACVFKSFGKIYFQELVCHAQPQPAQRLVFVFDGRASRSDESPVFGHRGVEFGSAGEKRHRVPRLDHAILINVRRRLDCAYLIGDVSAEFKVNFPPAIDARDNHLFGSPWKKFKVNFLFAIDARDNHLFSPART